MLVGKHNCRKFGITILIVLALLALVLAFAWTRKQAPVAPKPPLHESSQLLNTGDSAR